MCPPHLTGLPIDNAPTGGSARLRSVRGPITMREQTHQAAEFPIAEYERLSRTAVMLAGRVQIIRIGAVLNYRRPDGDTTEGPGRAGAPRDWTPSPGVIPGPATSWSGRSITRIPRHGSARRCAG